MDYEAKKVFLINCLFLLMVGGIVFVISRFMLAYLLPFVIGVILAFLMQKPARFLAPRLHLKNGTCAALLVILSYLLLLSAGVFIIIRIALSAGGLMEQLVKYFITFSDFAESAYDNIAARINRLPNGVFKTLDSMLKNAKDNITMGISSFFSSAATATAKNMPAFLVSSIVTIVASCYIAKDFELFIRFFKNFLSDRTYKTVVKIKNILTESVLKFVWGYFWIMCITFIELLFGFLLLRVKNAALIAGIVAVIDLLPVLGTGTVLIPWAVFSVISGDIAFGMGIAVLYLIITVIRNFAEPRIIGRQMGINPLFSLLTMFVGLRVFGILGMILVPVAFIVVIDYYKEEMQSDQKSEK